MKILKNFKKYIPEEQDKKELVEQFGVVFLKSEEGLDWYDCQKELLDGGYNIIFNEDGIIYGMTEDASTLYPENASVANVDSLPEDFTIDRTHRLDISSHTILKIEKTDEQLRTEMDNEVNKRIKNALQVLSPLQLAEKYGMSTEEEKTSLEAWEKYVILLNRVSSQKGYPSSVEWPEKPE